MAGCTSCSKGKTNSYKAPTRSSKYGTTKPSGGMTSSVKVVVGGVGYGTKMGSSYPQVRGSSPRTPISHAPSGRMRRH